MSASDIAKYAKALESNLLRRQMHLKVSWCCQSCGCTSNTCRDSMQEEYDDIISSLQEASDCLPRKPAGVEKDWWTPTLTQLRDQSMAIQSLWINEGRPRCGPTCAERQRVRASYKCEIQRAKKAPKLLAWNRLHSAMAEQDSDSFWKWWRAIYSKYKSNFAPVVDGQTSKEGIASAFQTTFMKN